MHIKLIENFSIKYIHLYNDANEVTLAGEAIISQSIYPAKTFINLLLSLDDFDKILRNESKYDLGDSSLIFMELGLKLMNSESNFSLNIESIIGKPTLDLSFNKILGERDYNLINSDYSLIIEENSNDLNPECYNFRNLIKPTNYIDLPYKLKRYTGISFQLWNDLYKRTQLAELIYKLSYSRADSLNAVGFTNELSISFLRFLSYELNRLCEITIFDDKITIDDL